MITIKQQNIFSMLSFRLLLTLIIPLITVSCTQIPPIQKPSHYPIPQNIPASEKQKRLQLLKTSYQLLGSPYKWGGDTPAGFDCSGLTRYVYRSANINIPRTAAQQRDNSVRVPSYDRLLPGDLIFFKTGKKTNHVGIFTGEGQFIHASSSQRRVLKTALDTPYWRRHFVKFGSYIRRH